MDRPSNIDEAVSPKRCIRSFRRIWIRRTGNHSSQSWTPGALAGRKSSKGLGWDEVLPDNHQSFWAEIFHDFQKVSGIEFPRCLTPPQAIGKPTLIQICDASEKAFGSMAFARWQLRNGKLGCKFWIPKSRVSPLVKLTMSRLDLQAAVLASRISESIRAECRFEFERTIYFSDSTIVLA